MDNSKVDLFVSTMNEKFASEKMMVIRERLMSMDDSKFAFIQSLNYKNPTTLLIVSLFLGSLGIDRFMLGQGGLGFLKLITCGGAGIWTIIDWFTVMDNTKEYNFKLFMTSVA